MFEIVFCLDFRNLGPEPWRLLGEKNGEQRLGKRERARDMVGGPQFLIFYYFLN